MQNLSLDADGFCALVARDDSCFLLSLASRLAKDDINIGRQIKHFHHITGTFDSIVLHTLCFITLQRLLAAALASLRSPRSAIRHDRVN
jgi:hypothetical protein